MGVQDYTDGKQVVHTLERTLLLLHLLVDGVDGLGASLDVEVQSRLFQLLLYRSDESGYILVARCLGFVQFLLDVVVDFLLRVLQRKVFQFRLQFVQTQLMGEGSVQIGGFIGHLPACLVVLALLYLAHDVHAVGNHDEDNAHVLCKGQQQVAEVLRLDGGAFGVKFVYPYQSAYDARHILAVVPFHLFGGTGSAAYGVVEHQSQDGCPPHAYLFRHDNGGLHILYNRVQPEDIPLYAVVLYRVYKMCFQLSAIALVERLSGKLQ